LIQSYKNLYKKFGKKSSLRRLVFAYRSEVFLLFRPNGIGVKQTLLKGRLGNGTPNKGTISVLETIH